MRSLDRLLGDRFFDLLEASAEEACRSVRLLRGMGREESDCPQRLSEVRQNCREIATQIDTRLTHNVMVSLKKEDIQALANALGRIPEAVERLVQRWSLAQSNVSTFDTALLAERLDQSAEVVAQMVRQLRIFDNLAATQQLHAQLRERTDAAERLGEEMLTALCRQEQDPLRLVMVRDLIDHLTAVAELCSECGNLVEEIVLKYG